VFAAHGLRVAAGLAHHVVESIAGCAASRASIASPEPDA
jgi:hypothetical protein